MADGFTAGKSTKISNNLAMLEKQIRNAETADKRWMKVGKEADRIGAMFCVKHVEKQTIVGARDTIADVVTADGIARSTETTLMCDGMTHIEGLPLL